MFDWEDDVYSVMFDFFLACYEDPECIYMYIHSLKSPGESTKNLFCFCWQGSSCWLSAVS